MPYAASEASLVQFRDSLLATYFSHTSRRYALASSPMAATTASISSSVL